MSAELSPERAERLRAVIPDGAPSTPPPAAAAPAGVRARARAALATRVGRVMDRLMRLTREDAVARERLERYEELAAEMRDLPVNFQLLKAEMNGVHGVGVNLELLKGEFRSLLGTVEELGMAIAPGAGIDAAAIRIAELRERLNALERRLRDQATRPAHAAPLAGPAPAAPVEAAPQSTLFDYVGFERRFRGDPEVVLATQRDRYEPLLRDHGPVLDIGCGRGELLGALSAAGIATIGVDTDPAMVAEARARGLEVYEEDAVSFLRRQPEHSLGSIISLHVAEHLQLDVLIEMLELAATRLVPGGLLIAETPNPASLIVLGNSYILDPTHVRPLHASLFTFLCEGAGFRDVRLEFYAPAADYHLPLIDAPDAPPWVDDINRAFAKLNDVLFGPQEYAVIAESPK